MGDPLDKVEAAYNALTDPFGTLNNSLFNNVFGDWLTFFNDILVGKEKGSDNDPCIAAILSKNSIETSQEAVIDIFNEHKQEIDQSVSTNQNITVNCGEDPIPEYLLEKEYDYNIFGMQTGQGCIKYGCCYDIEQLSMSSVEAINSTITEQHNEMYGRISSSITNNVDIEVGGQCNIAVLNEAVQKSKSAAVQKIQSILSQGSGIDMQNTQNVTIKSHAPLRCVNDCDEPPHAGIIKQSINVDIHSQNIVQSTYDTIIKNYKDLNTSTTVDIKAVPEGKFYLFAIISLTLFLIVYFIMYLIAIGIIDGFICKKKCPKFLSTIGKQGTAVLLMIVFFVIWAVMASAWRTIT